MKSIQWKTINILLLAAMSLSLVTCKVSGDTGGIDISISPNPVYALPVSTNSCVAQYSGSGTTTTDLTGPVMIYNRIRINWTATTSKLSIAYILLKYKSTALQGGEYQCLLQGQELIDIFNGAAGSGVSNVTIDPTVSTSIDNSTGCSLRCGSINLVSQQTSAYITGTATVVGVAEDSDGNFTPAQGQTSVTFQWDALN